MSIQELITWLGKCPVVQGDKLNWSYLASYSGWSLTIPKAEARTDILGNTRERWQLKITRRYTIQSNEDRLRIAETLEDLAAWAKENPPEHTHLKVTGLGGEGGGNVGMPISITYGGTRTTGTASRNAETGVVTFTAS